MKNLLARFMTDESGATAVEYALLAGLIAVVVIGSVNLLGQNLNARFAAIAAALN
jgi:pilus assembly protein Flp/PilA